MCVACHVISGNCVSQASQRGDNLDMSDAAESVVPNDAEVLSDHHLILFLYLHGILMSMCCLSCDSLVIDSVSRVPVLKETQTCRYTCNTIVRFMCLKSIDEQLY